MVHTGSWHVPGMTDASACGLWITPTQPILRQIPPTCPSLLDGSPKFLFLSTCIPCPGSQEARSRTPVDVPCFGSAVGHRSTAMHALHSDATSDLDARTTPQNCTNHMTYPTHVIECKFGALAGANTAAFVPTHDRAVHYHVAGH